MTRHGLNPRPSDRRARQNAPLIIGIASLAALWSVSALAVFGGAKLLQRVPMDWVRLVGAVALTGLGIFRSRQGSRKPGLSRAATARAR
jgi:hypothetical protein